MPWKMEQRTPEWFAARRGKITCSEMGRALAMSKAYANQLQDDLSGCSLMDDENAYTGKQTEWGRQSESLAVAAYELRTGQDVEPVGFVVHPEHSHIGGSPDGLVSDSGTIEVKCPYNPMVHQRNRLAGVQDGYMPQIQGLLWVTGREWCDFLSFDPREFSPLDLAVWRVNRDDAYIRRLVSACERFWEMVTSDGRPEGIPSIF